jgi:hypothetical protein
MKSQGPTRTAKFGSESWASRSPPTSATHRKNGRTRPGSRTGLHLAIDTVAMTILPGWTSAS